MQRKLESMEKHVVRLADELEATRGGYVAERHVVSALRTQLEAKESCIRTLTEQLAFRTNSDDARTAWNAVIDQLGRDMFSQPGSGIECAVRRIRELQHKARVMDRLSATTGVKYDLA